MQEAHRLQLAKTWTATFYGEDSLSVPGEVTFALTRPKQPDWAGPREAQPIVATAIPAVETRFAFMDRWMDYMVTQAVRTGIFLIPVDHYQEYKDSIRNLNGFLDMEKNDNFPWAEKSG